MSRHNELVPVTREYWPPKTTTDYMNFFLNMDQWNSKGGKDPGMADRAIKVVQALSELRNITKAKAMTEGNTRIQLEHSRSGSPEITEESIALTQGAYLLVGAPLTVAYESLKRSKEIAIYEGSLTVERFDQEVQIPIAFREVYKIGRLGKAVAMSWMVRTNYPVVETVEAKRLQKDDWNEQDRLIYLGAAIEQLAGWQGVGQYEPQSRKAA